MSSTGAGGVLVEPLTDEQIARLPTYTWDVARVGDSAPAITHVATRESIADYCRAVRNDNPLYLDPEAARRGPFGGIVAPPTYIYKCAPQRRSEVMHAQGYASPEEKADRATPYAKSLVEFRRPIRLGDEITSTVTLEEKYERRGNQFITWRVRAHNQHGEDVATYAYTIIWQQGPRETRPGERGPGAGESKPSGPGTAAGAGAASTPTAAGSAPAEPPVDPADVLPTLVKLESQEAIDAYAELTRIRPRRGTNLHTDPGFAQRTIFGGTVNMGVATAAYCSESIERAYGPAGLLRPGASLEYKGIRPIRAGYELTLGGQVVARRADAHACEIRVVNQDGVLCGIGLATVILDG